MIDMTVYSDMVCVCNYATERSVKDAVMWRDSMSRSLPNASTTHSKVYFFFTKRVDTLSA